MFLNSPPEACRGRRRRVPRCFFYVFFCFHNIVIIYVFVSCQVDGRTDLAGRDVVSFQLNFPQLFCILPVADIEDDHFYGSVEVIGWGIDYNIILAPEFGISMRGSLCRELFNLYLDGRGGDLNAGAFILLWEAGTSCR